jgi:hypothetical protein
MIETGKPSGGRCSRRLVVLALAAVWFVQHDSRRVVFASGVDDGIYHVCAALQDPRRGRRECRSDAHGRFRRQPAAAAGSSSGVDVAFMQSIVIIQASSRPRHARRAVLSRCGCSATPAR